MWVGESTENLAKGGYLNSLLELRKERSQNLKLGSVFQC